MLACCLALAAAQAAPPAESDYYRVDYFESPAGARLEVGGLDFLPDGRLVLSTRRGQVWIVENALADDPQAATFSLFAEGLHEGLGLNVVDGEIYVLQRGELSILRDRDRDGSADEVETVANGWGLSGHYHEFAFGLPQDRDGNFYITLNVSFGDPQWWHGRSTVPYRGWALRIARDGEVTPWAMGLRSPAGLGTNAVGDVFVTENQGDWMPACPIFHLQKDRFYGHPASLNWTDEYHSAGRTASDTSPPERQRSPAAAWIPYDWSRSAAELACDSTRGRFGPFEEQLFVGELTNGLVVRADLERIGGEYQGAVFPFRTHIGSAVRMCFAPDGSLLVGFTDRGWGGQPPGDGLARVRWTGKMPMEVKHVHLVPEGLELELTQPIGRDLDPRAIGAEVRQYDYDYWWEYGSPMRHERTLLPVGYGLSPDRTKLTVRLSDLEAGTVVRMKLAGVRAEDGTPLLHDELAYTLNQLAGGTSAAPHVAKLVPPPAVREKWEEGVLYLARGDALDVWRGDGWTAVPSNTDEETGGVELDPQAPTRLRPKPPQPPEETVDGSSATAPGAATPPTPPAGKKAPPITVAADAGAVAQAPTAAASAPAPEAPPPKDDATIVPEITNLASTSPSDLVTRFELGDVDVHVGFLLPEGGESGVFFMGRYEVQLADSTGRDALSSADCGGLAAGDGFPGRAPLFNACRELGDWHGLDVRFRAPRFDAQGKKIANARFERVMIDDTLLHENVEVPGPSRGGLAGAESALGQLRLEGTRGPVAFRHISVRPKNLPPADGSGGPDGPAAIGDGWVRIFDGTTLDGWRATDGGTWKVEDGSIVGSGARSHLFSPRGDYEDIDLRAKVKISDGGNSGMYFRVAYGPGWPDGYEAQVNSTHIDPVKTGSLYHHALVKNRLVPAETWFTQEVSCRDEPEGVHITIRVNGVPVTDFVDAERRYAAGHAAFQQHHEGSTVWFRDVEVRER